MKRDLKVGLTINVTEVHGIGNNIHLVEVRERLSECKPKVVNTMVYSVEGFKEPLSTSNVDEVR